MVQVHPGFDSDITISLESCIASFQTAIQLLHLLRPKFDVVIRHLDPLESYARQLGVPLPYSGDSAGQTKVGNQGEELVSEALAVLANTNRDSAAWSDFWIGGYSGFIVTLWSDWGIGR
jgi:hypothetical protein